MKLGDGQGESGREDEATSDLEEMRLEGRGGQLESDPRSNLGRGRIRDTAGLKP